MTSAERSRQARARLAGAVKLTLQARADLTTVRDACGDATDMAAVARVLRDAAGQR